VYPAYGTGGGMALLDEGIEQPPLVLTQRHGIWLGPGSLLSEVSVPKNTDKRNRCNRPLMHNQATFLGIIKRGAGVQP
jgi:hypothetical protein